MKLADRILKPPVFLAGLGPLIALGARAQRGRLGADPIAFVLHDLGWWALFFLLLSLAATPLQLVLRWSWPLRLRRMIGLFAFFYASLHLTIYLALDQGFAWGDVLADVVKRPFITVGFLAWLVLAPLALTSTRKMLQRLGFKRWKALHRMVYVAAALGVVHFYWRVKADATVPLRFAAVLGVLLAIRIVHALALRRRRDAPGSAHPAP